MPKTEIAHPDKKASTGAYSAGVLIDGWLYISGQGPLDLVTGAVLHGTIEEETRLTLGHIGKVLDAAGMTFRDVVERFNQVYREFFTGILPARTTVQSGLGGGIKVEIDAIARRQGPN